MPVVNTTSPTACASAAHASPSKRMPSSSSTYASRSAIRAASPRFESPERPSDDEPLYFLELWRACSLEQLEQDGLDCADGCSRTLQTLQAMLIVERMARADGVGRHVHFDPALEQVVSGLGDAYVCLDPAHDRLCAPAKVEAVGADCREDGLLDARLGLHAAP